MTTAPQTQNNPHPLVVFRNQLVQRSDEFRNALPSHITPEKFQRVVVTAVQTTPALLNADRQSLMSACMKAAQDGLLPDGREAALVQYKEQVSYMPMVAGLLKKARNSGEIKGLTAKVVYKNDGFRYWVDDEGEHLEHKPIVFGDTGEAIGAYAMAVTKDGGAYIAVLSKHKIEQHRRASKSPDKGPWATWWDEMAEKTAIRVLSKRLPASSDKDGLQSSLDAEEAHYDYNQDHGTYDYDQTTGEVREPARRAGRPTRLQDVARAKPKEAPPQHQTDPAGDVTDADYEEAPAGGSAADDVSQGEPTGDMI